MAVALVAVLALGTGCRGGDEPSDGSINQQFDDVESTLADIESDLGGD